MKNKKKLIKEISLVLVIKALLLLLLWQFCFSHPLDESLSASEISQHVYSLPSIGPSL